MKTFRISVPTPSDVKALWRSYKIGRAMKKREAELRRQAIDKAVADMPREKRDA